MKARCAWVVLVALLLALTRQGIARVEARTAQVRSTELRQEAFASVVRVPREGVAAVRARAEGTVLSVAVHEGDKVRAGQLLAVIELPPAARNLMLRREAERNEARAKLSALGEGRRQAARALAARTLAARRELDAVAARAEHQALLQTQGRLGEAAVTQSQLAADGARASYEALLADAQLTISVQRPSELRAAAEQLAASEAALDEARQGLLIGQVTSSIDGVVLGRHLNPGDVVSAGSDRALFEIANPMDAMLRGELDAIDASRVRVGMQAEVYALGGTTPVATATVRGQGARLERRELGFADVREAMVRPIWFDVAWTRAQQTGPLGERFEARIRLGSARVPTAVPRAALAIADGVAKVEVVWGPFLRSVPVKLGRSDRSFVEIIGLAAGTQVHVMD